MIEGSIVALVTPMFEDGTIDWETLDSLVEFHIENGTSSIVAVGTTGESATLTPKEHCDVIERVVKRCAGRIPVIAGTGSNSTAEAIELTAEAKALGADASLLVAPYYNKPTQEGLYLHYKAISEAVDMDHILYNVPGRTIVDMSNETVLRLADFPNIVAIKDATGDIPRGIELIQQLNGRMAVYSGDDATAYQLILGGAKGNISVTANVRPAEMSKLCRLALEGKSTEAESLNNSLMPLHDALFIESSPIPVKYALEVMNLIKAGIRLPLTPLSEAKRPVLEAALESTKAI